MIDLTDPIHAAVRWVYDKLLWDPWHKKSKEQAAQDPEWAAIEAKRHMPGRTTVLMFSDEDGLGMREWDRQREIEERVTPRPWWLRWELIHKFEHITPIRTAKFWHARATKGWAPSDAWNLDHFLSPVIAESVLYMRDHSHSWPGDPLTEDDWTQILTDIADGFAAAAQINNDDYTNELWYDPHDTDWDRVELWHAECQVRFEKGMDLFKKYFFSLWD